MKKSKRADVGFIKQKDHGAMEQIDQIISGRRVI